MGLSGEGEGEVGSGKMGVREVAAPAIVDDGHQRRVNIDQGGSQNSATQRNHQAQILRQQGRRGDDELREGGAAADVSHYWRLMLGLIVPCGPSQKARRR